MVFKGFATDIHYDHLLAIYIANLTVSLLLQYTNLVVREEMQYLMPHVGGSVDYACLFNMPYALSEATR